MPTQKSAAISPSEAKSLFSDLQAFPALVLAVSGGPDSTALMVLAARWRDALKTKPKLIAVTVDHGLRKESKARGGGGRRGSRASSGSRTAPCAGPDASRRPVCSRRRAWRATACSPTPRGRPGAAHILTAHTLDDQAETVLIRMSRGSGITGLAAMTRIVGAARRVAIARSMLVRPLLDIPKARLIATLRAAKIPFADDPSNRDPRFTRARLRGLMPALAHEGLDARTAGAAGAAAQAGGRRDRGRGRPGDGLSWRWMLPAPGAIAVRGAPALPICPPKSRCACSAARWPGRRRRPGRTRQARGAQSRARCRPKGRQGPLSPHPGRGRGDADRAAKSLSKGRRRARSARP